MALSKQNVPVPFRGGVNGAVDERLAPPNRVAVLDDALFDDRDTVRRRGGQTKLTLPGGLTSPIVRAYTHRDAPVVECSDGTHWPIPKTGLPNSVQVAATRDDHETDNFQRAALETRRVQSISSKIGAVGSIREDLSFDVAENPSKGTYCLVWEDWDQDLVGTALPGIRISIRDSATDKEIATHKLHDAGGTVVYCKPRVVTAVNGDYYVVLWGKYTSGNTNYDIESRVYSTSTGAAITGFSTIIAVPAGAVAVESAAGAEVMFDVSAVSSNGYAAVAARQTDAGGTIHHRLITDAGATASATITAAPAAKPKSITTHFSFASGAWASYIFYAVTKTLRCRSVPQSTNIMGAENTVYNTVTHEVNRIVAVDNPVTAAQIIVAFEGDLTSGNRFERTYCISMNTGFGGTAVYAETNCYIASRAFVSGSRVYLPLAYLRAAESVILTVDLTGFVERAAIGAGEFFPHAIGRANTGRVPHDAFSYTHAHKRIPSALAAGYPFLTTERDLLFAGTIDDTSIAIGLAEFDFSSQLGFLEINGVTLLAGGCPLVMDGTQVVEEGFHYPPYITGSDEVAGPATGYFGPLLNTPYNFYVTEAWVDSAGNWHESAPSNIYTVTPSLGFVLKLHVIRPFSTKNSNKRRLLVYRQVTSSTDPNFYLTLNHNAGFVNDTDLPSSEVLNLSVTPTYAAPPCRHFATFQNRVVASGVEDGASVVFTKTVTRGYAPEFCTGDVTFEAPVPARMGRAVASQEMDGKLVILGEHALGALFGNGPDDSGIGAYQQVETLVSDVGCKWGAPRSVGLGPEGVWFQSPYGPRVLGRSGGLVQIGPEVDRFITGNLTHFGGDAKQVMFLHDSGSGKLYAWDQKYGQWSRFSNFAGVDAIYALGKYYRIASSFISYYDETSSTDVSDAGTAGTAFEAYLETVWLQLAGLAGYQRVYRMALTGYEAGALGHDLRILTGYDYVESLSSEFNATITGPVVQFRHHMAVQKCEGLKVGIYWKPNASTGGTGRLRLTGLTLEVGVKAGTFKKAQVL